MKDRILCKVRIFIVHNFLLAWAVSQQLFRGTIRHDRSCTFLYSFIAADHWRPYLQISSFLYQSPLGLITMFLAAYVASRDLRLFLLGSLRESRLSTQHYWRTKVYIIIHGETANCHEEVERSSRGKLESSLIFNRSFQC